KRHRAPGHRARFNRNACALQIMNDAGREMLETEQLVNQFQFHSETIATQSELRRLWMCFPPLLTVRFEITGLRPVGEVALHQDFSKQILKQSSVGIQFR